MEQLKELVNIVNKRKLSQVEILDKSLISRKDTLFSKLYNGIADGIVQTDDDAIDYLYNQTEQAQKERVNYRKLKSRFKTRLLNTLYFIDINNQSEADASKRAYFECVNRLYLSNILLRYTDNRNASIQLIMEVYTTAKKYNFFDLLKEYAYKLLVHYGMTGNEKKYNEEYQAYQIYANEYEWEQQAQIVYTKVMMTVHYVKKSHAEKIKTIEGCSKELDSITTKSKSLVVYFISIRTQLFYNEIIGDHLAINKTCDAYLKNHKKYYTSILSETYLNTIYIYKLKSLFDLRKMEDALNIIQEYEPTAKGASYLAIKEFEIKILLSDKQYATAKNLIQQLQQSSYFKNANQLLKERWFVYNAYVEFLEHFMNDSSFKFSLSKFSNDIPTVSQDKSGFNLAARIAHILFYIGRNDLDNAMQQIESLRVYQSRHLKDENIDRENLFVKLLSNLEKKSFNYKNMHQAEEYSTLKKHYEHQIISESEIIFYDILWEMILEILKRNDAKIIQNLR